MGSPLPPGDVSTLIILTGSLGDVARGLPLAGLIKSARPDGHLAWVVDRRWAGLVELSSRVDEIITFDRHLGVVGAWRLLAALRRLPVDISLDLQRILKSGVIARAAGAPRRVGFHPDDAREGNAWFNTEFVPALGESVSKLRHYLAFAEHLGIRLPEHLDFGLARDRVAAALPEALTSRTRPFVVVVVGTSWPSKDWPPLHWQRLCQFILEQSAHDVVVVGARRDSGVPASICDSHGDRFLDLRAETTLPALAAVLAQADVAVGPDTGPGHVAAAVGTPYVGVFGPTNPDRVAPWGSEALAVRSDVECRGCPKRRCRRRGGSCMAAVTADIVWSRLAPLLAGAGVRS